jgi:16S rRNA (guanine(966)-N(2))-methyltransferase RsmD
LKSNRVRIIGGLWRSRLIAFPDHKELRPTPDRVRETLFNWLGQDLTGKSCLDLYAGSGALGFEAASRGAKRVVMLERDAVTHKALQASREALGAAQVEVFMADALEFIKHDRAAYDVVFLDPPFTAGAWAAALVLLPPRLAVHAVVYCESAGQLELPAGWQAVKQGKAGQVSYQLLRQTT